MYLYRTEDIVYNDDVYICIHTPARVTIYIKLRSMVYQQVEGYVATLCSVEENV